MLRTRAGYAGGTTANPTYHDLGDHTEVVRVEFDTSKITYAELLDVFFAAHDPFLSSLSIQYRSVILTLSEDQARVAREKRAAVQASGIGDIRTSVESLGTFTTAEEYHQKYRLRSHRDLMGEFEVMYPLFGDFLDSTAVARVNGYVGGYGTREQLEAEIDSLGLSASMKEYLRAIVGDARPSCGSPDLPEGVFTPRLPGL